MMIRRAVSNLDPGCHPDFSAPRAQERTAAPTTTIEHDRETTLPDHITLPSRKQLDNAYILVLC